MAEWMSPAMAGSGSLSATQQCQGCGEDQGCPLCPRTHDRCFPVSARRYAQKLWDVDKVSGAQPVSYDSKWGIWDQVWEVPTPWDTCHWAALCALPDLMPGLAFSLVDKGALHHVTLGRVLPYHTSHLSLPPSTLHLLFLASFSAQFSFSFTHDPQEILSLLSLNGRQGRGGAGKMSA